MIIGVTGDTHNNLKNIKKICSIFNKKKVELVVHTGDISLPKSLLAFNELNCPLLAVFGNNDIEEKEDLEKISKKFDCQLFCEPHSIVIDDKRISLVHHPDLINDEMILNNDLIFHGHTHRYKLEKIDKCIIFNPGECAGFMEGKNQIGLLDTKELNPITINF